MVMGSSKKLHLLNFTILVKSQKSQKFDAHEIYLSYSSSTGAEKQSHTLYYFLCASEAAKQSIVLSPVRLCDCGSWCLSTQ